MIIPNGIYMLVLVIVSLLMCCIGFKQFLWFMSIGYGLSAAGLGLAMLIMAFVLGANPGPLFILQCVLFIIYGIRLGGFLLVRQLKNEKYRAKLQEAGGNVAPPIFVSIFMWIFCGLLYICEAAGPVYRLGNLQADRIDACLIIGIIISALGIVIEALADKQKSDQKKENSSMPAMKGLFKMCRCPNYFGEILFWTGAFVSGLTVFEGAQWVIAILGYIAIVGIMLSGAKRLETRHIKNYGKNPEYNAYADKTPIIFPLIPLYHMTSPEKIASEEAAKKAKADKKRK